MWIARILDNSWLSCHKYAQRASQQYDRTLPLSERAGLIFHHYLCPVCRRFAANIEKMQRALRRLSEKIQSGEYQPEQTLAPEKREQIINSLRQSE